MAEDKIIASKEVQEYYKEFNDKITSTVEHAKRARKTRRDVHNDIESLPARGIAEKTELLVGPPGVAEVYLELWEKHDHDRFKVIIDIFHMILDKKLGNIEDPEKRLDQAIRTALIIETEGVVVSPLDGLPEIKISENQDGTKYADIYYAGPIRAAGGNAQTLPLLLADMAREKLHLDRFKPSKAVIDRVVEEVAIYQNEIVARQQRITEEEIRIIVENCIICVNSFPDTNVEVIVNRDLKEVPSNRIRGAMCLVLIDGLYVRAMRILKTSESLGLNWKWLEKLIKVEKTSEGSFELRPSKNYLDGMAAGRPVFGYPLEPGSFRLRYGKGRNTGLMAKAINPATMYVLDEFLAVGTHGRIERPGKSLQFFPCSTIDGPIVRLKNKDVISIDHITTAKKYKDEIEKILFVGDMLISVGDFKKSGHPLLKNGFVEEEWLAYVKYLHKKGELDRRGLEICSDFYRNPDPFIAVAISLKYKLPLFPHYLFYYDLLTKDELLILIKEAREGEKIFKEETSKIKYIEDLKDIFEKIDIFKLSKPQEKIVGLKLDYKRKTKEILEKIGLVHKYLDEENKILIEEKQAYPFLKVIGALNAIDPLIEFKDLDKSEQTIVELLTKISGIEIRDKSGTYIGARMGRPEAAHARSMAGKPNALFPIGKGFGNNRDLMRASFKQSDKADAGEYGINNVEIKAYYCEGCKQKIYHNYCYECNQETKEIRFCKECNRKSFDITCSVCNTETTSEINNKINLDNMLKRASKNIGEGLPPVLKGVKDLVSDKKIAEPLEKGILRAKHDVYVFRDGTCRYEALNATISQFTPRELNLTLEKVKELGYKKDYLGNDIKNLDQRISIFPQDIIVDENCGEYFLRVTRFIDDLLEKFYKIDKFYNAKDKYDLIGAQVIGLAPHTSAGIVGRIIGFSKAKLCWGHPYYITAKRRNVDGDQDSMLLLMDGLLNFSQSYLSTRRGGRMDAPLAFTTTLSPYEIDDESHEIETNTSYAYEFYEAAKNFGDPDKIKEIVSVNELLGTEKQYDCIKFTHDTNLFDEGPKQSSYITIRAMKDKVFKQAELQGRIKAVDQKDALERLLHFHLFPDIIGNTRAFARQKLRCVKCNAKFRRVPLSGECACGGKIILTIAEGSIKKYLQISKDVITKYDLKPYLMQRIALSEEEINSLFVDKDEKMQRSLSDFF